MAFSWSVSRDVMVFVAIFVLSAPYDSSTMPGSALGQIHVPEIQIDRYSSDEIPPVLKGLQLNRNHTFRD